MTGLGEELDGQVVEAARQLVGLLRRAKVTLASAESLTGGLLAAAITAVPGASRVYRGGVIAYATDLKDQLLGVDAALLQRVGAVDPLVADAMAQGVRQRLGADCGLATTGVAGPDPLDGKPPGTVWVGVATGSQALTTHICAPGARADVRRAAVLHALRQLHTVLGGDAGRGHGGRLGGEGLGIG